MLIFSLPLYAAAGPTLTLAALVMVSVSPLGAPCISLLFPVQIGDELMVLGMEATPR